MNIEYACSFRIGFTPLYDQCPVHDIHTIDNQYYVLGKTKGGLISELFFTLAQIFQKRCQKTIFRTIQLKREDSYDSDMANFFWRFFFKAKNLRLSHL